MFKFSLEFSQLIEFSLFIRNLRFNKHFLSLNNKKLIDSIKSRTPLIVSYINSINFDLMPKQETTINNFLDINDIFIFYVEKNEPWLKLVYFDFELQNAETFFIKLNLFLKSNSKYLTDDFDYKFGDERFKNLSFFIYVLFNLEENNEFTCFLKYVLLNNNSDTFQIKYVLKESDNVFDDLDIIYNEFRLTKRCEYFLPKLNISNNYRSKSIFAYVNDYHLFIKKTNQHIQKKFRDFCFIKGNTIFIFLYAETTRIPIIKIEESFYNTIRTENKLVYSHIYTSNKPVNMLLITEDMNNYQECKCIEITSLNLSSNNNNYNINKKSKLIANRIQSPFSFNTNLNAMYYNGYALKLYNTVYKSIFKNEIFSENSSMLNLNKHLDITYYMVTLAEPVSPLISFEYTVLLNKNKINNINNEYAKKFLTIHRTEDLILGSNLFNNTYADNDPEICSFKKLVNFKIDMIKLSDQEQINRTILFYKNVSSTSFTSKHLIELAKIVNNEKNIKNYKPDFKLTFSNNFLKEVNFSLYFVVSQELLTFNKNKAGKNVLHSLFFVDFFITDFKCKNLNSELFTLIDLNHSVDNQLKSEILNYTLKNPNLNNFKFSILITRECTFKVKLTTRIKVSSNLRKKNSNFSVNNNIDSIDDLIELEIEI